MNVLVKMICLFLFLLSGLPAFTQIREVTIGVNGLTCSACTRSVEMQLRKLDFIKDVRMDLESTAGTIYFASGKNIDFENIAAAVKDAGFSVRELIAMIEFERDTLLGSCMQLQKDMMIFVKEPPAEPVQKIRVKFVGKKYLPGPVYRELKPYLNNNCKKPSGRVYYIMQV